MEVQGGTDTDVVVRVAIPVVDVETVLVEVADTRDVTGVDLREVFCLSSSMSMKIEFYCFCKLIYSFLCIYPEASVLKKQNLHQRQARISISIFYHTLSLSVNNNIPMVS